MRAGSSASARSMERASACSRSAAGVARSPGDAARARRSRRRARPRAVRGRRRGRRDRCAASRRRGCGRGARARAPSARSRARACHRSRRRARLLGRSLRGGGEERARERRRRLRETATARRSAPRRRLDPRPATRSLAGLIHRPASSAARSPAAIARATSASKRSGRGGAAAVSRAPSRISPASPRETCAARVGDETHLAAPRAGAAIRGTSPARSNTTRAAVVFRRRATAATAQPSRCALSSGGVALSPAIRRAPAERRTAPAATPPPRASRRGASRSKWSAATRRPGHRASERAREIVRRQAVHAPPKFDTRARCRYVPPLSTDARHRLHCARLESR